MAKIRGEEWWAAVCVRAALPGVTVRHHDDGTAPSMHDLEFSLGGHRPFGAMEVTSAADRKLVRGSDHLAGLDTPWSEDGLVGGWSVRVRGEIVRGNRLRRELPSLLRALERTGITRLPSPAAPDELVAKATGLGVARARQDPTHFPGSIFVTLEVPPERSGGAVATTGDALSEWVSEWMLDPSQSDNLDKLRRSRAPERHLFVIVPGLVSTVPFPVTDLLMRPDAPLPTVSPRLPPEVTHVWIVGLWADGHGFRWSPGCGWETFANTVVPHHP